MKHARILRRLALVGPLLLFAPPARADLPVAWLHRFLASYVQFLTDDDGVTYSTYYRLQDGYMDAYAPDGSVLWSDVGGTCTAPVALAPNGMLVHASTYEQAGVEWLVIRTRDRATGVVLSEAKFHRNGDEYLRDVAMDTQGAAYVGAFRDDGTSTGAGLALKVDATGQIVWERLWKCCYPGPIQVRDVQVAPDGDVVVLVTNPVGYRVEKLTASAGSTRWGWVRGSTSQPEVVGGLQIDAAGDVFVTATRHNKRIVTVKWDGTDGHVLWETFDFPTDVVQAIDLTVDAAGSPTVVGNFYTGDPKHFDTCILRFRGTDGALVWTRLFGEPGVEDKVRRVFALPTGRLAVGVSTSESNLDFTTLLLDGATGAEVERERLHSDHPRLEDVHYGVHPAGGLLVGWTEVNPQHEATLAHFEEPPPCAATVYCDEGQNPDNTADIGITGCDVAGPSSVTLTGAPPKQVCLLLVGDMDGVVSHPPGSNGDLCVAGGACVARYAKDIGPTTIEGAFATNIASSSTGGADFGLPCGGRIDAGETWYFQFWHRRPAGQASGFSSALAVTFH